MVLHKEQALGAPPPCITDGDLVIVYEQFDAMKAVYVDAKQNIQSRFGCFPMKVSTAPCLVPVCTNSQQHSLHQMTHVMSDAGLGGQAIWKPSVRQGQEPGVGTHPSTYTRALDAGAQASDADPLCR